MISLNNINYSYNNIKVLDNYSLKIKEEGITVISGPNGSGKTTLLKIISKIIMPDSGTVKCMNNDIYDHLGFVFQRPILLKRNVYENLSYILKNNRYSDKEIKILIDKYLEKFFSQNLDMFSFMSKNIFELSGGEQQLISLIRTLVSKPKILFLDEPFTNLDDNRCEKLASTLFKLSTEKCKIIMVTHKHSVANKISSDIISL